MKADLLVDAKCTLGEGVQWNPDHQRIWWTDIHGRALWSCDADGGAMEMRPTIERLGSFAFDADNCILAAFESGLFRWDLERDRIDRLTDFEPEHPTSRLNDGRCDRAGRFVTGGMDEDGLKHTSTLIRYDGARQEVLERGVGVTNSICFSPDGAWMYFADTPTKTIKRYPYDTETGALGASETFFTVDGKDGFPDGSCVDAAGSLWNARFWGGRVQEIRADGTEGLRIDVDAPQVTCACFGGPKLDRLYITTAREHFTAEQGAAHPLSGGLFIAEPGAVGLPEDRFASLLFP
ncbi:MAG: SMP-30/gluconolactonase/LRE family protein [Pseudomonadota bacterium]